MVAVNAQTMLAAGSQIPMTLRLVTSNARLEHELSIVRALTAAAAAAQSANVVSTSVWSRSEIARIGGEGLISYLALQRFDEMGTPCCIR